MKYMSAFHTSAEELGDIAERARPKMLILTHWMLLGNAMPEDLIREIRQKYGGPIVIARDLERLSFRRDEAAHAVEGLVRPLNA